MLLIIVLDFAASFHRGLIELINILRSILPLSDGKDGYICVEIGELARWTRDGHERGMLVQSAKV